MESDRHDIDAGDDCREDPRPGAERGAGSDARYSERVARAAALLGPHVRRTPIVAARGAGRAPEIFLKCENLQVTGSFKLRGAVSAVLHYARDEPAAWSHIARRGVVAYSTGNFAQALAHVTARHGLGFTAVVHAGADAFKIQQITRENASARVVRVPYETWRQVMRGERPPEQPGFFLSSETDEYVSLGTATLALEVLEDLPGVDCVLVPFGGGNLAYSVGSVLRERARGVAVYAVEVTTGAPLAASFRADRPVEVAYERSFVDGIGASFVIPAQFDRLRRVVDGVLTVSPQEIAAAVRDLAVEDRLVCEGAGAAAYAAARKYSAARGWRRPCCVLSGGVIDPATLAELVRAQPTPRAPARPDQEGTSS